MPVRLHRPSAGSALLGDVAVTVMHLLDARAGWITDQVVSPIGGTDVVR